MHAFTIYDAVDPLLPRSIRFLIAGKSLDEVSVLFSRVDDTSKQSGFDCRRDTPPEAIAARICLECP